MNSKNSPSLELSRRAVLAAVPALAMSTPALTAVTGHARQSDILDMGAVSLARALRRRDLSARDLMTAHLARVDALNPRFNAIVSRIDPQAALDQAAALDEEAAGGRFRGPLHGFPHAVKDTAPARGIPFTQGSPLLRNNVPSADSLVVSRMRAARAIFVGKTNVPEFALGSHSYNPVFGITRNAFDPRKSAGGSTGGGAVALALRMVPVTDGSDFGGSLRNPAGWNNIFGFRPSWGRVPSIPNSDLFWQNFATSGPMARSVGDLALLLSVQAGPDKRAPFALADDPGIFARPVERDWKGKRIGWLGDLGGALPMEPGIMQTCEKALSRLPRDRDAGRGSAAGRGPRRHVADRGGAAPLVGRRRSAGLLRRPGEAQADEARGDLGGRGRHGVDRAATGQGVGGKDADLRGVPKSIRNASTSSRCRPRSSSRST